MSPARTHDAVAREIIESNQYMTLGTADDSGRPWVSPVWYAPKGYDEFFWVSREEATHSRNITIRPEIAIVIFDSRTPIGTGQGVYMSALAERVADPDVAAGIDVFSRRSVAVGGREWGAHDVRAPAALRLYRARVSEHFVLDHDPVTGRGVDRRIRVAP
jgi:hypothetical protein